MSKFVIREVFSGVKFDLFATNGQGIAASEVYDSRAACIRGIESVRRNAPRAKIEDQTSGAQKPVSNPKFEIYTDKAGQYRFRLRARNGKIIAVSESYTTKAACISGIESVQRNAPNAELE